MRISWMWNFKTAAPERRWAIVRTRAGSADRCRGLAAWSMLYIFSVQKLVQENENGELNVAFGDKVKFRWNYAITDTLTIAAVKYTLQFIAATNLPFLWLIRKRPNMKNDFYEFVINFRSFSFFFCIFMFSCKWFCQCNIYLCIWHWHWQQNQIRRHHHDHDASTDINWNSICTKCVAPAFKLQFSIFRRRWWQLQRTATGRLTTKFNLIFLSFSFLLSVFSNVFGHAESHPIGMRTDGPRI